MSARSLTDADAPFASGPFTMPLARRPSGAVGLPVLRVADGGLGGDGGGRAWVVDTPRTPPSPVREGRGGKEVGSGVEEVGGRVERAGLARLALLPPAAPAPQCSTPQTVTLP